MLKFKVGDTVRIKSREDMKEACKKDNDFATIWMAANVFRDALGSTAVVIKEASGPFLSLSVELPSGQTLSVFSWEIEEDIRVISLKEIYNV